MAELAVLLTASDSRGFMCGSKWKWPVTFPVALDQLSTCHTLYCFHNEPWLFVPSSLHVWCWFLNMDILSLKPSGPAPQPVFFLPFNLFFSLASKCLHHTTQSSRLASFENLQVLLKSYVSQGVMCGSRSWLNVSSFFHSCCATQRLRGRSEVERVVTQGDLAFTGILLWCCYYLQRIPTSNRCYIPYIFQ